jgi:serine/threonine protein kinase
MDDGSPSAVGLSGGFCAGSRIAGYRLEEQIGQGGMAVVFRAQDERLERQVALKILSPALATDEAFRHRFIRESRSAAAADDPHIIPVFEAGDADGVLFIAMRYVPGGDVGALVKRLGPLPIACAAAIISGVASALDAAHAAGLVHRDVKPSNMLLDARVGRPDHVYLSDFGLTKGVLSSADLTGSGHFMGTLNYSAPEQIQGRRVDARTDEYALACTAFALLSGEPPFSRDEDMAVLYAQLSAPPPLLTSLRDDLPPTVDDVLQRALAKAPKDRYASCGEFADALRMALGLQRYAPDAATVLHQRTLADQQDGLEPDASAAHASMAAAGQQVGNSDETPALDQQTLADQLDGTGTGHPDALATQLSMSRELAATGDRAGPEDEFRHVFTWPLTLGLDHADTLAAKFLFAQRMAARGDHAGAKKQFRHVFATRRRALGPDHPDTLVARFGVAQEMAALGDHAGAKEEFRHVFATRQRALGPDHPDTLLARFGVAQEMAALGDHARAEEEFRAMLPYLRRKFGPDHPDTLATRCSIAREMAARGDHAEAEREFRHVLPFVERQLGADHPVALILWLSIAREMAARGDHAGAEGEFRHVLPHLKRTLGADHPDTLAAFEWIDYLQGKTDDRSGEPGPNPPAREREAPRGQVGRSFGAPDSAPLSDPEDFLVRPYAVIAGRTQTRVLASTPP